MALGVRGANPIWLEVDLQGNLFDDTYYLFVLENTIPYIPAVVYHDPDLNIPWTNPIRFLGNGTLPVDIYFESDKVYRLEFRQGNTQSAPLIYEVDNYTAGSGGSTPIDTLAFASSNQITNPQFSLISFSSPLSLISATNPDPIEVAPGWFLELAGTGSATITQVPLNNTNANPTNAPYALRLTLNGWDESGVFLRQRFQQNGMLWADKIVSSSVTARIQGAPQAISAALIDSNGVPTSVLDSANVNGSFNEYTGYGELPAPTNPDVPPAAYIDYKLALPSNVDIYVTSIQLVVQEIPIEPSFEQDSIERQVDHTFHYYRDSIIVQPKNTVLCGWNFGLNPWQSITTGSTTLTVNQYTADQTIVIQQNYVATNAGSNVSVQQGSAALRQGFQVNAVTATNKFALLQYIDPTTIRPYWNYFLSSLVRARIVTTHGTAVRFKLRLIVNNSLPGTISRTEPIASWSSSGEPVLQTGWSYINANNDPTYTFANGYGSEGAESFPAYPFDSFKMPNCTSSTQTLGILLYTLDNMNSTSTADSIVFDRVSLVPISFAIDSTPITFDEELRRLQYYYEQSYKIGDIPGTATIDNAVFYQQWAPTTAVAANLYLRGFTIQYNTIKRAIPAIVLYAPTGSNLNNAVSGYTYVDGTLTTIDGTGAAVINAPSTNWSTRATSTKSIYYTANRSSAAATTATTGTFQTEGLIAFHFTANARLGA